MENGDITLIGVVSSQVEKAMLESIARNTMAFKVDSRIQVEREIEKEPSQRPSGS